MLQNNIRVNTRRTLRQQSKPVNVVLYWKCWKQGNTMFKCEEVW